jgi:hypothetical protein
MALFARTPLPLAASPRLADFIPTRQIKTFYDLDQVHFLMDGGLGYGWSIDVPAAESIDGAEDSLCTAYAALLAQVPADHVLELYVSRDHNIEPYLVTYRARVADHPLAQDLKGEVVTRWLDAQTQGFFPDAAHINFQPRRQAIHLFLKTPPKAALRSNSTRALFGWLRGGAEVGIDRELREVANEFRQRVMRIQQTAQSAGLSLRPLEANAFVRFVGGLLFPQNTRAANVRVVDDDSIADAVSSLGEVTHLDGAKMITASNGEQVFHQAISMMWQPQAPYPGMFAPLVNNECDITFMLSFRANDQAKAMAGVKLSAHLTQKMTVGFNSVEMGEKAAALEQVQLRMARGESKGAVRMVVWVRGSSERNVSDRCSTVHARIEKLLHADVETTIGSSVLLNSLPMAHTMVEERAMSRTRAMMSEDAATMAPLSGYWEGTNPRDSLALYCTKWCTPLFLDPRVCDTNPHLLIVGGSGSGKTFWVQDFLMQLLTLPRLRVFLISIKPDYERLARLFGRYIQIDLDGDHAINPFAGEPTHDSINNWVTVVQKMLTDTDARMMVSKEELGLIGQRIMEAAELNWDRQGNKAIRETILSDIVLRLELDSPGREIAKRLLPYHKGQFARLLNRPNTLHIDDRFVFWNLSRVVDYSCIGVVSLCVFNHVNGQMYDPTLLGDLKIVGLDEGWATMSDESSAGLVNKAFRAYRSLNGLAFIISQLMSDFDTPLGQAILGNTATKVVLRQAETALAALPKYLALSAKEMGLIRGLDIRKRFFSEFFVSTEGRPSTVGRVIPAPLRYAVATTDADDSARFAQLAQQHGDDYVAAIREFAARYPYGQDRMAA